MTTIVRHDDTIHTHNTNVVRVVVNTLQINAFSCAATAPSRRLVVRAEDYEDTAGAPPVRRRRLEGAEEAPAPLPVAKSLDELFKKTKTLPSLYYLPLTDEQVRRRVFRRSSLYLHWSSESRNAKDIREVVKIVPTDGKSTNATCIIHAGGGSSGVQSGRKGGSARASPSKSARRRGGRLRVIPAGQALDRRLNVFPYAHISLHIMFSVH